jgi:hypothetical protein
MIVSAFCISVSSCKKNPLDITPDGRITLKDVFADEVKTEAYLNSVYSFIPDYFDSYQQWNFLAGCTDDAQDAEVGNNPGISGDWISGSLTPSYDPLAQGQGRNMDHYASFWSGIRRANVFLANIGNADISNATNKSRFIAEAHLLRAFYYFELIKQYGPMPIEDKPYDPSFDYTSLTRPTFQDDIDFIVKDCDTAIANSDLPLRIILSNFRGRFSKAVAYALKSRALLYNASPLWNPANDGAKWRAAADASETALTALTQNGEYALASDYSDYFLTTQDIAKNPKDKETIYESEFPLALSTCGIPSKPGSWKLGATPSQELVDAYDMQATGEPAITGYSDASHLQPIVNTSSGYDPDHPYVGRDPRFYATVWYNGAKYDNINGTIHTIETYDGGSDQLIKNPPNRVNTHTGYYLRKYIDPKLAITQESSARFRIFRLAEIYLNYAEAENEVAGPTSDVYKAINTIRQRAQMPDLPSGLTKDQMRERIHREERVEFPYEEHRFWDVRRWKILNQTDKLVTGMEIKATSGGQNVAVANAGFESGTTGWSMYPGSGISSVSSHSGTQSVSISGSGGGQVAQTITVSPNTTYTLTAWMNVTTGSGYIGVRDYGSSEVNTSSNVSDWTQKTVAFTTGPTSTTAVIFSWWPAGGIGYVDDFEVSQSGNAQSFTYKRFVTERRNAWQDKYLIFPIPIKDASIIPYFGQHQNPGW